MAGSDGWLWRHAGSVHRTVCLHGTGVLWTTHWLHHRVNQEMLSRRSEDLSMASGAGASRLSITLGLYSLSGKTSYRQISWSLEAARLCVIMIVSHWNLTGISAALLPSCLSNCRAIEKVYSRISRLRDFTRSCGKTSYGLVNRGPDVTWASC